MTCPYFRSAACCGWSGSSCVQLVARRESKPDWRVNLRLKGIRLYLVACSTQPISAHKEHWRCPEQPSRGSTLYNAITSRTRGLLLLYVSCMAAEINCTRFYFNAFHASCWLIENVMVNPSYLDPEVQTFSVSRSKSTILHLVS
jgi:hypothetical protein